MTRKRTEDSTPDSTPDGIRVAGSYHPTTATLTYTCPGCGSSKAHHGKAFVWGIIELCRCGSQNDVIA